MDLLEPHNVLFVYDALMRGMERERFLSKEKTKFLCPATTQGVLYSIGNFTGLVLDSSLSHHSAPASSAPAQTILPSSNNGYYVRGELFEIFDPITFFATLDVIEGYWSDQIERSLFVRKLIVVETEKGETQAWAYVLNLPLDGLLQFDSTQ